MLRTLWSVAAIILLVSGGFTPSEAQEDRNLTILKVLYTKIRNRLTLGDNSLAANQSFLVLTDPGIVLDPQWDMAKVGDQEKLSRLLGRAPKATWLYRPANHTIEAVYRDVLRWHNTPRVVLTKEEQDQLKQAKKLLYSGNQDSKAYKDYVSHRRAYSAARIELEYARERAEAEGKALDPKYQDAVTQTWNDWNGPKGQKQLIEAALNIYAQLTGLDPAAWWTELQDQFTSNLRQGPLGQFAPILLDADYKRLFAQDGWMSVQMTDQDLQSTYSHEHTAMAFGGSGGWGLWHAHVNGQYVEDKGHSTSDVKAFTITMEIRAVGLSYPWMNPIVFRNRAWRWDRTQGANKPPLSDGGDVPSRAPEGDLPFVPTTLILARNVKVKGQWNTQELSSFASQFRSGGSFGWGPFAVSGSYSKDVQSGSAHSQFTADGFEIPDAQVIGIFCDVLPRSPYPDPTLTWVPPLSIQDVREFTNKALLAEIAQRRKQGNADTLQRFKILQQR